MLLLLNTCPKSGSHWLKAISQEILKSRDIPFSPDLDCAFRITSSDLEGVTKLLCRLNYRDINYVFQTHLRLQIYRDLFLNADPTNVKVVTIFRDIRDVFVSSYYHHRDIDHSFSGTFKDYVFSSIGIRYLQGLSIFHKVWDYNHPNLLVLRFEDLKNNFGNSVNTLSRFCGVENMSESEILHLKGATSIDKLRTKNNNSKIYRKGKIGSYQEEYDEESYAAFSYVWREMDKFEFNNGDWIPSNEVDPGFLKIMNQVYSPS